MISKERLEQMYWDKEMSQYEIAKEIGVSHATVNRRMKKYGIGIRTCSEAQLIDSLCLSKEEFEQMYWGQGMIMSQIAKEIGVTQSVVSKWMRKYGIHTRTHSESLVGRYTGENAGNWNGGTSFEPYCSKFNNNFKEAVRKRDDYTCQLCGCEQLLGGQKLDVHHIHYDKENCYPDVVALCRSCNGKVNSNRNYWEDYFENELVARGLLNWRIN